MNGDETWAATADAMDRRLLQTTSPSKDCGTRLYNGTKADALRQLMDDVRSFISGRSHHGRVVVKTSTTGARPATHEISHDVLQAVLEATVDVCPAKSVYLADGPAYASYVDECTRLGWDKLSKRLGIKIIDLNEDECTPVALGWPVANSFLHADLVLNLSKAKTHRRFGVSLGYKNLLGVLSGRVLGYPKLNGRHRYVPRLLAKISALSPPTLSVVDGLHGIEGDGPLNGMPTNSQFVAVGEGHIGADVVSTVQMGFDPVLIPVFHLPSHGTPTEGLVQKSEVVNWQQWRISKTDYLPPPSMPWLYRSLESTSSREERYKVIMRGMRECWETTML